MKIYAITQHSPNKEENEDRILVGRSVLASGNYSTVLNKGIIAVADGVGGNLAGAVASHLVITNLSCLEDISIDSLMNINDELIKKSHSSEEYNKMATTLAGITIGDDNKVFYVGNSRVYALQGGKYLKQLTVDDTTLNYLITTGQLSEEEAADFQRKNEITACFGGGDRDLCKIKMSNFDQPVCPFLITSDGVHDFVSADDIEDVIDELGISIEACNKIAELARANGSLDDISIIMGDE